MLPVPYRSQEDPDARRFRNDCGPACVAMLIAWQSGQDIPIDTLSEQTSLARNDDGLATAALIPLAAKYNLTLTLATLTLDSITNELSAGRPVIALISYRPLLGRENQADHFGHFVVVVGIGADNVYLNDSDWWNQGTKTREDGHNWGVPRAQFEAAMRESPVAGQGLVIALTPSPSPKGEGNQTA